MSYLSLKKYAYANRDADIDAEYLRRYNSEYAHHINFTINDYPAFFIETPEIIKFQTNIRKIDKTISKLCSSLPSSAIRQFTIKCLIDEIDMTNSIEGVSSTRREINSVLNSTEKTKSNSRLFGLVYKYSMLQNGQDVPISTGQDIRKIYDELVLDEVILSNPKNRPDGKIFRTDTVKVQNSRGEIIHEGLYPETKIISAMTAALNYLNDSNEDLLYRMAAFHYLIGYIHPFYDGNGRLNRFISSYMITKELEPVLSYRLSYTIKEHITSYYKAFSECNDTRNYGDITEFIEMMLGVLDKSISNLRDALQERSDKLEAYKSAIRYLPHSDNHRFCDIYLELIQAELFAFDRGISLADLSDAANMSKSTTSKCLHVIRDAGLLKEHRSQRSYYYGIDLNKIAEMNMGKMI